MKAFPKLRFDELNVESYPYDFTGGKKKWIRDNELWMHVIFLSDTNTNQPWNAKYRLRFI